MQTDHLAETGTAGLKGVAGYGLYALVGGAVGLFSGLFGVGGGIIMVPFLVVIGFAQQQANGISLAAITVTAAVGAFQYWRGGTLTLPLLPIAVGLAVGSIPGAIWGASIAQRLSKEHLGMCFALFLVIMAVRIMPKAEPKSMGLLLGVLLIVIGIRMLLER